MLVHTVRTRKALVRALLSPKSRLFLKDADFFPRFFTTRRREHCARSRVRRSRVMRASIAPAAILAHGTPISFSRLWPGALAPDFVAAGQPETMSHGADGR